MSEKPIVKHDFIPQVAKIRDEDPSKFLGGPSLVIRSFKHEKDRIKVRYSQSEQYSLTMNRKLLRIIINSVRNTSIPNKCIIVFHLNSEEENS